MQSSMKSGIACATQLHAQGIQIFVYRYKHILVQGKDILVGCIYPKISCEQNCTSKGFSCNLDLAVKRNPQGISFDKCFQPEYAGIDITWKPHVRFNISIAAQLGVIGCQFYRFLSSKAFFVSQMVKLIVLPKNKAYSLKVLLKRTRELVNCFLGFQHLEYPE